MEGAELCDDENTLPFDGCSVDCQIEPECTALRRARSISESAGVGSVRSFEWHAVLARASGTKTARFVLLSLASQSASNAVSMRRRLTLSRDGRRKSGCTSP